MKILHRHIFLIDESGVLKDIGFFGELGLLGYFGGVVRPDIGFDFTDYTFDRSDVFWISIPERDPDPLAQYLRLSQTRHNWDWTIEC